jgi:hypothetical protein
MTVDRPGAARCPAITIHPGLGTHARLAADGPGNGSPFWAVKSASSNTSADSHARIFGLSLAALGAVCLVLNAASPSARICPQSGREFGTTGTALTRVVPAPEDGSHVQPSAMIRSKECEMNEGGEEPGY